MGYMYATTDCVAYEDGKRIALHTDQVWDADDEFVKARPDLFSDTPTRVNTIKPGTAPVEQATAAPGEKRNTRRRAN